MKNPDDAIEDYSKALKIDPGFASSLYGRGIAEQTEGGGAAERDFTAAKAIEPNISKRFGK